MEQPDIWLEKIFCICGGNENEVVTKDLLVSKLSSIEIVSEKNKQIMNKFIKSILSLNQQNQLNFYDFQRCYSSLLDDQTANDPPTEIFMGIKEDDQNGSSPWLFNNSQIHAEIDAIKDRISSFGHILDNSYTTNLRLSMIEKQVEELLETSSASNGENGLHNVNKAIEEIYSRLGQKEAELTSLRTKVNEFDGEKIFDVEKLHESLNKANCQFSSLKLDHIQLLEQHRNLIYELDAEKHSNFEISQKLRASEESIAVIEENHQKEMKSISQLLGLENCSFEDVLEAILALKKTNESLGSQIENLNLQQKNSTQMMESDDSFSQIGGLLEDKHKMSLYIEKLVSRIIQNNPELLEIGD